MCVSSQAHVASFVGSWQSKTQSEFVLPRPTKSRPTESRPAENRPTESKPPGSRPTESRPPGSRPTESRPHASEGQSNDIPNNSTINDNIAETTPENTIKNSNNPLNGRKQVRVMNGLLDKSSECSREITKMFKERIDDTGYTWRKVSQPTKNFYFGEFKKPRQHEGTWDAKSLLELSFVGKASLASTHFGKIINSYEEFLFPLEVGKWSHNVYAPDIIRIAHTWLVILWHFICCEFVPDAGMVTVLDYSGASL
ncbi:hypothetical protein Tco_1080306 [Tanacetum coccineum]|uniref:Uncharacterized protein n=1 Tax=Tanacetum coccineum TaxID=301880 RepID=A0ABQ5HUC6_9ASTR